MEFRPDTRDLLIRRPGSAIIRGHRSVGATCIGVPMHDDGYFSEEVAARFDDSAKEMFSKDMVEPVVDFLVDRSGGGRAIGHPPQIFSKFLQRSRCPPRDTSQDTVAYMYEDHHHQCK